MRFNPGGLLEAAVQISDMFLGEGQTIVSVKGRAVPDRSFDATDNTLLPDVPVVVLANGFSASASEIVTGALADNGRAFFVGERTFGKGSVQQVKMLDGEHGALKITNAYYYLPSGRNIHRKADAETWGVDPSEGAYVRMTADERREMIQARRDRDIVDEKKIADSAAVDAPWLRETLKDPQLAAAYKAVLGKLETGDWPTVGASNADALVLMAEQEQLQKQRELLEETLAEVNQKLSDLEAKGVVGDPEDSASGAILEEDGGPVDEITEESPEAVEEPAVTP
jgi:carboxyl-terminal processing protease